MEDLDGFGIVSVKSADCTIAFKYRSCRIYGKNSLHHAPRLSVITRMSTSCWALTIWRLIICLPKVLSSKTTNMASQAVPNTKCPETYCRSKKREYTANHHGVGSCRCIIINGTREGTQTLGFESSTFPFGLFSPWTPVNWSHNDPPIISPIPANILYVLWQLTFALTNLRLTVCWRNRVSTFLPCMKCSLPSTNTLSQVDYPVCISIWPESMYKKNQPCLGFAIGFHGV